MKFNVFRCYCRPFAGFVLVFLFGCLFFAAMVIVDNVYLFVFVGRLVVSVVLWRVCMRDAKESLKVSTKGYLLAGINNTVSVPVDLEFNVSSPYTVRFTFRTGVPVVWEIGRDLLTGSEVATGGDVTLWYTSAHPTHTLVLALRNGVDEAVVAFNDDVMQSFLAKTFELVPAGSEMQFSNLDAVLVDLF